MTKSAGNTFTEILTGCLMLMALPIDWFQLSGEVFREVGAKPAILFLSLIALITLIRSPFAGLRLVTSPVILLESLTILILGFAAFSISVLSGGVSFNYQKDPVTQFIAQSAILGLFFFASIYLGKYFSISNRRLLITKILPWVAGLHFAIFLLENFEFIDDHVGWLLMFRTDGGAIDRATGLMSEPSYYGAFTALFGMPLLLMNYFRKYRYRILGILLLFSAYLINSKTMVMVIFFQIFFYALFFKKTISKIKLTFILLVFVAGSISMITTQKALTLQENLSSVNRLGSSLLGLNLALNGYGLTGVGIGQFHFYYKEKYAPDFLFYSEEAQEQFRPTTKSRASTYNFYIRLLAETGFIGLLLFLDIIRRALKNTHTCKDPATQFGVLLLAGSLGFLMTQDTYFYPPLVLALALLFSKAPVKPAKEK